MKESENNTGKFLEKTEKIPEPNEAENQKGSALVPFPTNLKLTKEQEDRLIDHVFERKEQLERELGRDRALSYGWYKGDGFDNSSDLDDAKRSFFGKRDLYEAQYQNDVTWRPYLLGGIFKRSNLTVPLSRRICRQMISRYNNYFFGTDPWMAAYPVGIDDTEKADRIDQYGKHKSKQSRLKKELLASGKAAFIRGEAVVKTAQTKNSTFYKKIVTVMSDPEGNPLLAADGDFITETDEWIEGDGVMVLKRDGQTEAPPEGSYQWKSRAVSREITHYKGPESTIVYFKDFLCPLTATSVQDADCVMHLYDMSVDDLVDSITREENFGGESSFSEFQKKVSLVRELADEDERPKAAKNQVHAYSDEDNEDSMVASGPTAEIAEVYVRFDADEDGIQEEIMVQVDCNSRRPVFYDYLGNVTEDGTRPFDVHRVNEVEGRWYGIGAMEMFESSQEVIDLMVNRWNMASGEGGRLTVWNPENTLEGQADPDLKMNWGETYTAAPGKTIEDIVDVKYLENIKHNEIRDIFEFFLQIVMNESGVQHANDANMVGLDQAKLATGIRNIEKSGQEMFSMYLSEGEPCLAAICKRFINVLLANLDEEEAFEYFDGRGMIQQRISPEEVADVHMDVRMELTRYKGEQQLQSNMQAVELVERFFSYPPELQIQLSPFYVQMLKALEVKDAEQVLSNPGGVMLGGGQEQPGSAGAQGLPPSGGGQGTPGRAPTNL